MVLSLGLCLTATAKATAAQERDGRIALWDMHLASSMSELLLSDDFCHTGPYRLYRQTCVGNELNITLERDDRNDTLLDRVAIFVHRHKDLNLAQEVAPGTKFRLKAKLSDLYDQEAEVSLTLRMLF